MGRPAQHATRDPIRDLDDTTFFEAVDGHVTMVDFWAPWCAPCRILHPRFTRHAVARADGPLRFARVNVQDSPAVAATFGIMSIPTILVIGPDCAEIAREVGVPGRWRLARLVRHAGVLAGANVRGGTT